MDGAATTVEKMIPGKQIGTGADGAKGAAHCVQTAQLVAEFRVQRQALDVDAGAQKCNVGIVQVANRFLTATSQPLLAVTGFPSSE